MAQVLVARVLVAQALVAHTFVSQALPTLALKAANPIHVDQGEHVLSKLMIITHATVIEDIQESTVKKVGNQFSLCTANT